MILLVLAVAAFAIGCTTTQTVPSVVDDTVSNNAVASSAEIPADASFSVDLASSRIHWQAYKLAGDHTGTVMLSSGSLQRVSGEFTSGDFVMDMATISDDDGNEGLEGHLISDDFFAIEKYPTSTFMLKSATLQPDGTYLVTGDLSILDSTNEISFPAMLSYVDGKLMATASFSIDRTLWGLNFRSSSIFADIGDKVINDNIDYTLDLVFIEN